MRLIMVIRAVFFDVGYTLFDETRLWREWAEFNSRTGVQSRSRADFCTTNRMN
jgi:hypothetical protein